jgi:hypothetical protein
MLDRVPVVVVLLVFEEHVVSAYRILSICGVLDDVVVGGCVLRWRRSALELQMKMMQRNHFFEDASWGWSGCRRSVLSWRDVQHGSGNRAGLMFSNGWTEDRWVVHAWFSRSGYRHISVSWARVDSP